MAEVEVKVFQLWASYFGMRVTIALLEKGVPFDYEEVDLFNKTESFLKASPIFKKVPVLIHNGKALPESGIILEYIDETWPGKSSYMPTDPYEKAQARFWTQFFDKKVHENASILIFLGKGQTLEEGKQNLVEYLGLIEGVLGDKTYFGGEEFGYLDMAFIPFWPWVGTHEVLGEFNFSLENKFPKLKEWAKRCMQRDSVKKVLPSVEKLLEYSFAFRDKFFNIEAGKTGFSSAYNV